MTKIDVFSGFLGAGKTTLIRKLLKEAYAGQKVVLIENEFGEIGIDGGFLKEAGVEVTEMNSGCICCSLVGDFEKALLKVLRQFAPDRVLIEPSGVGKLSDVVGAIRGVLSESVVLGSLITVADATKCKLYMKNFGEFYNDQIEHAGAIVLSRTDGMNEDKLAAAVGLLRARNENATIVTTPWEQLDGVQLLAAIEQRKTLADEMDDLKAEVEHEHEHCHCHEHEHEHHHEHGEHCHCHEHEHEHEHEHGEHCHCHEHEHEHEHEHGEHCHCHEHEHEHHHEHGEHCHCHDHEHEHHHEHGEHCHCHDHDHHHHHADEVFTSFGKETARLFEKSALEAALEALDSGKYGMVLRAKGIVAGVGGVWLHFDYVPGEVSVREGSADVIGRLCVIGAELDEHALCELFGI